MGRKKIEIKYLQVKSNRKATYRKRSQGLRKKAEELDKLCGAKVFLMVMSNEGKEQTFISDDFPEDKLVDVHDDASFHPQQQLQLTYPENPALEWQVYDPPLMQDYNHHDQQQQQQHQQQEQQQQQQAQWADDYQYINEAVRLISDPLQSFCMKQEAATDDHNATARNTIAVKDEAEDDYFSFDDALCT